MSGGGPGSNAAIQSVPPALGTPKGLMFCHWKLMPPPAGQLGVFCHTPASVDGGVKNAGGAEPSPTRFKIIAVAAACPVATPSSFAWLGGIAASDAAYWPSRSGAAG